MNSLADWRRLALTLFCAALAGAAMAALHAPLPWLIGPLLATAAASLAGWPVRSWGPLRHLGQWVIGTSLGLTFTPEASQALLAQAPAIALGLAWALLAGYLFYRFLAWFNRLQGLADHAAAFFAAAIGGASEMALLAERAGAPVDKVAAAHSMRVLLVVTTIPLAYHLLGLHGADAGAMPAPVPFHPGGFAAVCLATGAGMAVLHRLGWPNPWVLGSLAVALALTASGQRWSGLPPGLAQAGQLFIGVALGTRFTPAFARHAPRWLAGVALGSLALMALAVPVAAALARAFGLAPASVYLGVSPGGIAEMCITAQALGLGVPLVTAFQVLRYVGVMVLTRWLWPLEGRRLQRRAAFKGGRGP